MNQILPKVLICSALAYGIWITIKCPCDTILSCHIKEMMFVFTYCTAILIYYNGIGKFLDSLTKIKQ